MSPHITRMTKARLIAAIVLLLAMVGLGTVISFGLPWVEKFVYEWGLR